MQGGVYGSQHDDGDELPDTVRVMCNGVPGIFLLPDSSVICGCQECCAQLPLELLHQPRLLVNSCRSISPTEFERHAGMGATRKWRHSIKVLVDLSPNAPLPMVPASATDGSRGVPISIGRWLDEHPPLPRQPPPLPISHKPTTSRLDRASRPSAYHQQQEGRAGTAAGNNQPGMQAPSRKRTASQSGGAGVSGGGAAGSAALQHPRPAPQVVHVQPSPLQTSHPTHYLTSPLLGSHENSRRMEQHHMPRASMPMTSSMHPQGLVKFELSTYGQPGIWEQRPVIHPSPPPAYNLAYYREPDAEPLLRAQAPVTAAHQYEAPQEPEAFETSLQQWQQLQPSARFTPDTQLEWGNARAAAAGMPSRTSPSLRTATTNYMPNTARLATAAAVAAAAAAEAAATRRLAYQHAAGSPPPPGHGRMPAGPDKTNQEPNPLLMMLAATAATQQLSRSTDSSPSDQDGQEPSNGGPVEEQGGGGGHGGGGEGHRGHAGQRPSQGGKHDDADAPQANKHTSGPHVGTSSRALSLRPSKQAVADPLADSRGSLRVLSFSVRPVQANDSLATNPVLALRISMDGLVFCGTLACEAAVTNVEAVRTLLMLQPQQTPPAHMVCALCMRGPPPSRPGTNLGPLIPVHVTVKPPVTNAAGPSNTTAAPDGTQAPAAADGAQPSNPAHDPAAPQHAQADAPEAAAVPPDASAPEASVKQEPVDGSVVAGARQLNTTVATTVELSSQTLQEQPGVEAAGHQVNQGAVEQQVKPEAEAVPVKPADAPEAAEAAGAGQGKQEEEGKQDKAAAEAVPNGPTHCLWLHLQCACWCPEARVAGGKVLGLVAALKRAHRTRCCSCGRLGASLVCSSHGCGAAYHLPCAQLVNCSFQEQGPHACMLCPSHRQPTKDAPPGDRSQAAPVQEALPLVPASPGHISQGFSLGIADDPLDPSMASLLHPRADALLPTTPDLLNIIDDDPMMDLLTAGPGDLSNPQLGAAADPADQLPPGDAHRAGKRARLGPGGSGAGVGGGSWRSWGGGVVGRWRLVSALLRTGCRQTSINDQVGMLVMPAAGGRTARTMLITWSKATACRADQVVMGCLGAAYPGGSWSSLGLPALGAGRGWES